jgi:hypothetical protein
MLMCLFMAIVLNLRSRGAQATVFGLLFGLIAGGCEAIHDIQRDALFRPDLAEVHSAREIDVEGLERWWLDVEEGRVEAWYFPPVEPRGRPGPAVIVAHGNAEVIDDWAERVGSYRRMGLAVLLPEYRGYGRSDGAPSQAALLADFARFYDRLVDRPQIDPARVVLHGYSLGGGVVGVLSDRRRAAALILESTFTNVPDLASRWMAPMGAIADRFDTRAVLQRASTPTLILHGVDDAIVPFQHAAELHRVAWDSRLVAYRAGHDDLPRTEAAYWSRIRAFLEEARVLEPRPPPGAPDRGAPARRPGTSPGAGRRRRADQRSRTEPVGAPQVR